MNESGARKLSLTGAVLAALAASSCCLGPLVLAGLGLGGAGALAALSSYRGPILGVTAALLAAGFYLTYRKPRAAAGDACGCEVPRANRAGKVGLWLAAALVAVLVASPNVLARVYAAGQRSPTAATAATQTAIVLVQGADCEACAAHLRSALGKVGGLHELTLNVATQSATVTFEPAPGRLDAYVAAIDDLGYEARITATRGPQ